MSKKILIIDDEKNIRLTLSQCLETSNYDVETAVSGEHGLTKYNESKYDIILLDMKMPGIDGIEVLRRVKNTPEIKRIPVIILTSSKEEGDRAMSYDLGANSYLVKPISFDGFLDVVRKVTDYWITLNIDPPLNGKF